MPEKSFDDVFFSGKNLISKCFRSILIQKSKQRNLIKADCRNDFCGYSEAEYSKRYSNIGNDVKRAICKADKCRHEV